MTKSTDHTAALRQISETPRVYVADGFLTRAETERILSVAEAVATAGNESVIVNEDECGRSFELPVDEAPLLADLQARIEATIGMPNRFNGSLRFRHYQAGQGHPPHLDTYEIDGSTLILTAILYLNDVERGGETLFPDALPAPLPVHPRRGRLAIWFGHGPDGRVDPLSLHESLPVETGSKTTLTCFVYQDPTAAGAELPAVSHSIQRHRAPRFFCVTEDWLSDTNQLFERACDSRGIPYLVLDPAAFDSQKSPRPSPGDLLYRVGTSMACMRLEQLVHTSGVAGVSANPLFGCFGPEIQIARAGIRVPRSVHIPRLGRDAIAADVEMLGGFPLVVKVPGGEGGMGVMRVDGYESLFSLLDFAPGLPIVMEYFEHVLSYRLVVVGERVVGSVARCAGPGDFRTNAAGGELLGAAEAPDDAVRMALDASRAVGLDFGGADVLESEDGELLLTEFNSPCYFADVQEECDVDIAGALLEHLVEKARSSIPTQRA